MAVLGSRDNENGPPGREAAVESKTKSGKTSLKKTVGGTPRAQDGHVGKALRSAYQQTVSEDVPSEFLDLLSKLA
jgi:hypothetical protein